MKFSAYLLRLATLLVTFVVAVGVCFTTAQAGVKHSVSGDARFQIGDGLPIPIGFTAAPHGKVNIPPGAVISVTGATHPKTLNVLTGATHPGTPAVIGVFLQNSNVFQVKTAIPLAGKAGTWAPGLRTGPAVVTFCGGFTAAATGTGPPCPSAAAGKINGLMRYSKITNQFGGPNQGSVGGIADVALRVAGTPPGVVTAIFAFANPAGTGAQGAPFGWFNQTAGAVPNPGVLVAVANANGTLLTNVATVPNPGLPNPATSYGGPYTTGMLTVSVPAAVGGAEIFQLTGADNRNSSGIGTISLVSGSVANRGVSGPNANRGWVNLTIGPPIFNPITMPAVPVGGLAAAFGLLALAGGYAVQRRRSR